jgi:hypothetical protein
MVESHFTSKNKKGNIPLWPFVCQSDANYYSILFYFRKIGEFLCKKYPTFKKTHFSKVSQNNFENKIPWKIIDVNIKNQFYNRFVAYFGAPNRVWFLPIRLTI